MSQYIFNLKSDASVNDTSLKFDLYQLDIGTGTPGVTGTMISTPTFQVLEQDIKVYEIGEDRIQPETYIVSTNVVNRVLIVNLNKSITGNISAGESIVFRKFVNKVNGSLLGYDKNTVPLVDTDLPLSDYYTGNDLIDISTRKPLTTTVRGYEQDAAYVNRAMSIVASTNPDTPLKIKEMFPIESEVSSTLLGVLRGERQLGLFSDVSVMGLDTNIWEIGYGGGDNYANGTWYRRKTKDLGNYYTGTVQEVTSEQALRLACFPVKYSFPSTNSQAFDNFKEFVTLGQKLYTYFNANTSYPANFKDNFLNSDRVNIEILIVYNLSGTPIRSYDNRLTYKGITEDQGLLLIDIWTKTFDQIKLNSFINPITNIPFVGSSLISLVNSITSAQLPNGFYGDNNPFDTALPGVPLTNFRDNVYLTSRRTFRYQPGRVSGFTFGVRATSDSGSSKNAAEWGIANPTDELLFQLKGNNMNIVRRSSIPLPYDILDTLRYYDQTSYLQTDPDTGKAYTMYEYALPKSKWNHDSMDGNGPSGYLLNPDYVTMYKIEFSWYGAIGANFYIYIPVGNTEARWVLAHRMVIENKMSQAWLQEAFFKFKYALLMRDSSFTESPQYLYKYGASYYIDGGDEGTNTYASITTESKATNDTSSNIILGISPKTAISNSVGEQKKNKKLIIPKYIAATSTKSLVKLDVVNCKACPGFGFTYDQGLKAPTINPASKQLEFRFNTNTTNDRLVFTTKYEYPITAINYSTTSVYLTVLKDSFYKAGDKFKFKDLTFSRYQQLTGSVYIISNVLSNPRVAGIDTLTLAITGQSFQSYTPVPPASSLNIRLFSQLLGMEDNDSKILVNGIYGYYLDTHSLRSDILSYANPTYYPDMPPITILGGSTLEGMIDTSITNPIHKTYYNCAYLNQIVGTGKKTPVFKNQLTNDTRYVSTPTYPNYISSNTLSAAVLSVFDGNRTDYYIDLNYFNIGATGGSASTTPYYPEKAIISNYNNSLAISDYAITSPKASIRFLYTPNTYALTNRHYSDFRIGVVTKKPMFNSSGQLGIDAYSKNLSAREAGGIKRFITLSDRISSIRNAELIADPLTSFLFTEFTPSTIAGATGFSYGESTYGYSPYNVTSTNIPNTLNHKDGGVCSKVDISFTKNVILEGFTVVLYDGLIDRGVNPENISRELHGKDPSYNPYRVFLVSPDPRFGNITNIGHGMFSIPKEQPNFDLDNLNTLKNRILPGQGCNGFMRNGARGSYVRDNITYYYAEVNIWFTYWSNRGSNLGTFTIKCHLLTLTYSGATTTSSSKMYPCWNGLGDLTGSERDTVANIYNYETDPFPIYPAVQLLDGACINSISIQETNDTVSTTASLHWLTAGNILVDNVGGLAGTNNPIDLLASIPETFNSQKRLEAAQYDVNTNRSIRRSILTSELASTMASFYIGASSTKTINLDKIFNVDRNVITQDAIGSNAVFFTAKNINTGGSTVSDNTVQITLNVAEQ